MKNLHDLTGRVAVVVGATSGIDPLAALRDAVLALFARVEVLVNPAPTALGCTSASR